MAPERYSWLRTASDVKTLLRRATMHARALVLMYQLRAILLWSWDDPVAAPFQPVWSQYHLPATDSLCGLDSAVTFLEAVSLGMACEMIFGALSVHFACSRDGIALQLRCSLPRCCFCAVVIRIWPDRLRNTAATQPRRSSQLHHRPCRSTYRGCFSGAPGRCPSDV